METASKVFWLSIGGVAGVNARYWIGEAVGRTAWPWGTFAINLVGAFLIGLLTPILARWLPHANARLILIVGFLGGFTTFSAFALESIDLGRRGALAGAVAYVVGSVGLGILAAALGLGLGSWIAGPSKFQEAPRATR